MLTNLDKTLSSLSPGKLMINISDFIKLIADMCRTIEVITENEFIIDEFRNCGIRNSKMFRHLYLELIRKGLKEEKYNNFEVFRRDLH